MGAFRYMRPDELMTKDATVTGTIDTAYQPSWLCDLRPGYPVRGEPSGALSLTITNLTDEIGNRFAFGAPITTGEDQITPLRPRTARIGFEVTF